MFNSIMGINIYPHRRVASRQVRLRKIRVRPATGEERDRWNEAVSRFHYLGNADLPGRQIRYVAETFSGRCVALISFGSPALQLAARDRWIGWHPEQRLRRLQFVVQNSRFLIFPWIRTPNLASRVMALCLDRLESDWRELYGYAPVLVETFVEQCRKGTSYRADNWIRLGETAGFSRSRDGFYRHNGSPKTLWVKPLRADAVAILGGDTLPPELAGFEHSPNPGRATRRLDSPSLCSLLDAFRTIEDPRGRQGRKHSLATCLAVVACGALTGARGLSECAEIGRSMRQPQRSSLRMWRNPRTGRREAPSHTTLWRAVSMIDPLEFEPVLKRWYNAQAGRLPNALAIDGKAIRATLDGDKNGLHVVSAVPHGDTPFLPRPQSSARATSTRRQEI